MLFNLHYNSKFTLFLSHYIQTLACLKKKRKTFYRQHEHTLYLLSPQLFNPNKNIILNNRKKKKKKKSVYFLFF